MTDTATPPHCPEPAGSEPAGSEPSCPEPSHSLAVPDLSLVVLIGTTGAGKSTFARKHFLPTQVVSSDVCRGLVADDENDQAASPDAFDTPEPRISTHSPQPA